MCIPHTNEYVLNARPEMIIYSCNVYSNEKIQVVFKIHPKVLAQDFPSSFQTFQSSRGHVLQNGLLVKRNDPFVLLKQITYQTHI